MSSKIARPGIRCQDRDVGVGEWTARPGGPPRHPGRSQHPLHSNGFQGSAGICATLFAAPCCVLTAAWSPGAVHRCSQAPLPQQSAAELVKCDLAGPVEPPPAPLIQRRLGQPPSQAGNVMPMNVRSLPAVLRACARLQPNDTAFTFFDYEQDWAGVEQSLTWSQLYRRTLNVARELSLCGSTGDRAVILAPQGLDYICAFLGAMQAGLIAVPLSVPQGGATDERVDSVLRDASPVVILTTSSVIGDVAQHVTPQPGESAPSVIEVDRLDLDSPNGSGGGSENHPPSRICNTRPVRPVRRPASCLPIRTSRPMSNS